MVGNIISNLFKFAFYAVLIAFFCTLVGIKKADVAEKIGSGGRKIYNVTIGRVTGKLPSGEPNVLKKTIRSLQTIFAPYFTRSINNCIDFVTFTLPITILIVAVGYFILKKS